MALAAPAGTRVVSLENPVDLRLTLGPLRRGASDDTIRFAADGVWRATRTPEGPATVHLTGGGHRVEAEAWGPGAGWVLDAAADLVGARDGEEGFDARHPVVAQLRRRLRGLRISRSNAVVETHNFRVDALRVSTDLVSGRSTDVWLKTDQTGSYQYYCSIHSTQNADGTWSGMTGTLVVG